MQRPQGKDDDPFLRIAIPFILGVVMGFSLVLMGLVFLALGGLSLLTQSNETPAWIWLTLGVISEVVGAYLMKRSLGGTPEPGQFGPGTKNK